MRNRVADAAGVLNVVGQLGDGVHAVAQELGDGFDAAALQLLASLFGRHVDFLGPPAEERAVLLDYGAVLVEERVEFGMPSASIDQTASGNRRCRPAISWTVLAISACAAGSMASQFWVMALMALVRPCGVMWPMRSARVVHRLESPPSSASCRSRSVMPSMASTISGYVEWCRGVGQSR